MTLVALALYLAVGAAFAAWAIGYMHAEREAVEPRFAWLAEVLVAVVFGMAWLVIVLGALTVAVTRQKNKTI